MVQPGQPRSRACLCCTRPRHQQLPPVGRPALAPRLQGDRRLLAHHPARRRRHRQRRAVARGHGPHPRRTRNLRRQDIAPQSLAVAARRHRGVPDRQQRRGFSKPCATRTGARHRDSVARGRGEVGRIGMCLADRHQFGSGPRLRHRRRVVRTDLARSRPLPPAWCCPPDARGETRSAIGRRRLDVAAGRRGDAGRNVRRAGSHQGRVRGDGRSCHRHADAVRSRERHHREDFGPPGAPAGHVGDGDDGCRHPARPPPL